MRLISKETVHKIRGIKPDITIIISIPLDAKAASRALELSSADVDTFHFYADDHGNELNTKNPRFLKELIREVHLKLVDNSNKTKD